MKKKIKILDLGDHILDQGTKFRTRGNSKTYWITVNSYYQIIHVTNKCIIEVDFSEVPPLYPHKDLDVPKEGIEFADDDGKLLDIGKHGIVWDNDGEIEYGSWEYVKNREEFKLKRQLPPTIEVCADCFKEACECKKPIPGNYYRITGKCDNETPVIAFCVDSGDLIFCGDEHCYNPNGFNIDLDNPIQVESGGKSNLSDWLKKVNNEHKKTPQTEKDCE